MKLQRLLVALDSSPRSQGVLDAAIGLAQLSGGRLVVLRAVGMHPDLPPIVYAYANPDEFTGKLVEHERTAVRDMLKNVPPQLVEEVVVDAGAAWESICRVAKDRNVDLIVIGSHGYNVVDRVVGTTAAKVVNHADRPTLVVRNEAPAAKA